MNKQSKKGKFTLILMFKLCNFYLFVFQFNVKEPTGMTLVIGKFSIVINPLNFYKQKCIR